MIDILKPLIKQFMPFAQEKIGFERPPKLFLRTDAQNAANPLGKTAFYDPSAQSVTLYVTGRHPKDILRSLAHELVHHKQNCDGQFANVGEMGEGYAQTNPHLRQMEIEANRDGSMCLRDWEDGIKGTIYFEHLQKGDNNTMSTKTWKNKELTTLLSEAWGFGFDLNNLNEAPVPKQLEPFVPNGPKDDGEEAEEKEKEEITEENEQIFAPNHYCVHHGGVQHNGQPHMAEAISHNFNEELGRVTHYDMKLADGTVLENVAFEDIQVTNASLSEGHGGESHPPMKRDTDETDEENKPDSTEKVEEQIRKLVRRTIHNIYENQK